MVVSRRWRGETPRRLRFEWSCVGATLLSLVAGRVRAPGAKLPCQIPTVSFVILCGRVGA